MIKSLPVTGLLALILVSALVLACGSDLSEPKSGDDMGAIAQGGHSPLEVQDSRAVPAPGSLPLNESYAGDTDFGAGGTGGGGTAGGGTGAGGTGGADGGSAGTLPTLDRQIIRTAIIQLTVEDVAGAMQRVETAAAGAGGFVSGSSLTVDTVSQREGDEDEIRQRGTITIRVPAASYSSVMSNLRGLVEDSRDIKSLTEDASEVTEEYTDLQSRLRNLEATEVRYLDLLGQAESIEDILRVQDRLNSTRFEIEQVQGRLQVLDDLTAMATITIELSLPPVAPLVVEEPGSQNWAEEALDNAWQASEEVLRTMGVIGITAGVFLAWLLVPGVIGLAAWRIFAGRRAGGEAA